MTDENWYLDDWQVDFPDPTPYTGPIINMPISQKLGMMMKFLFGEVWREVKICIDNKTELAALLLCLSSVDYMAGYCCGHKSEKPNFMSFLDRFFPEQYRPYRENIYDQLRSGLFHNLVTSNPFCHSEVIPIQIQLSPDNHLTRDNDGQLIFSVSTFSIDIKRAWVMYSHELLKKEPEPALIKNFNRRFNRLNGAGALMIRKPE